MVTEHEIEKLALALAHDNNISFEQALVSARAILNPCRVTNINSVYLTQREPNYSPHSPQPDPTTYHTAPVMSEPAIRLVVTPSRWARVRPLVLKTLVSLGLLKPIKNGQDEI